MSLILALTAKGIVGKVRFCYLLLRVHYNLTKKNKGVCVCGRGRMACSSGCLLSSHHLLCAPSQFY